jgi:hypothetical protein
MKLAFQFDFFRHAEALERTVVEAFGELQKIIRHPRALSSWLEANPFLSRRLSRLLNRRLLGAASNWLEPFTIGMGLAVERLSEEAVEVTMPSRWRNQGDGGAIHTGAFATLGEFCARLLWDCQLDLRSISVESRRVHVRILVKSLSHVRSPSAGPFVGPVKGVFRLPVADREAILHRLRNESSVDVETETHIYDSQGRLIAEVEVAWQLSRVLSLEPGTSEV